MIIFSRNKFLRDFLVRASTVLYCTVLYCTVLTNMWVGPRPLQTMPTEVRERGGGTVFFNQDLHWVRGTAAAFLFRMSVMMVTQCSIETHTMRNETHIAFYLFSIYNRMHSGGSCYELSALQIHICHFYPWQLSIRLACINDAMQKK